MLLLLHPPTNQVVKGSAEHHGYLPASTRYPFSAREILLIGGSILVRSSDTPHPEVWSCGLLNASILIKPRIAEWEGEHLSQESFKWGKNKFQKLDCMLNILNLGYHKLSFITYLVRRQGQHKPEKQMVGNQIIAGWTVCTYISLLRLLLTKYCRLNGLCNRHLFL